jgi:hypothetical protein
MSSNAVLFGSKAPDVYLKGSIATATNQDGKFIPTPGSLVIDNTNTVDGRWTIEVVKSVTVPPTGGVITVTYGNPIIKSDNTLYDRFVDYGNDMYMAFYGNKVRPTTGAFAGTNVRVLYIDDKLAIYSAARRTFKVVTADAAGNRVELSRDPSNASKTYLATVTSGNVVDGAYRQSFPACYVPDGSLPDWTDDLPMYLEIYDTNTNGTPGNLRSIITLTSRSAVIPNVTTASPIVDVKITTNQDLDDGSAYLFINQDISALTFFLQLTYANGQVAALGVDNTSVFLYGSESLNTAYVNVEVPVLCKYFMPGTTPSQIGELSDGVRVLQAMKTIRVIPLDAYQYTKLSLIPVWNAGTSSYTFKWSGSTDTGATIVVPSQVTITAGELNGTVATTPVTRTVTASVKDNSGYTRSFVTNYKLMNPANDEFFNIWDDQDATKIYGKVEEGKVAPIFSKVVGVGSTSYQFDITRYVDADAFLTTFFTRANPPTLLGQGGAALTPTHFILRNASGTVLTSEPQSVLAYGEALELTGTTPGITVQKPVHLETIVIEFITIIGDNPWIYHYAVPVLVKERSA